MARYKMLEGYISRAYEDKLGGLLAEDLWRQKNDGWRAEQAKLTNELGILRADKDDYRGNAVLMLELAQQAVVLYEKGSAEKTRKLVEIACSNRVLVNGTLRFDYQKPFDILAKVTGKEDWWR